MKKLAFLTMMTILLTGCFWDNNDLIIEETVTVTQNPVNLSSLNSKFDDYNSTLNFIKEKEIIFSSNRNSQGKDFDLIYKNLVIKEDPETKVITIEVSDYGTPNYWENIFRNVNSTGNEFGPYFKSSGGNLFFMYSTQKTAGYDIYYLNLTAWYSAKYKNFDSIPKSIPKINEYADDLYPTFSTDKKNIIFCSNKNSNVFNIYNASFNNEFNLESLKNGEFESINKIESLSSLADDKCPFIGEDEMMVFASTRKGGYGGYDVWYSFYINGLWTEPKNFGREINTSKDEFRPITFKMFNRNFMIFSSNRKGGLGGFDLYAVEYDVN